MVKCEDNRYQGIKQGEKCCEQSSDEDNWLMANLELGSSLALVRDGIIDCGWPHPRSKDLFVKWVGFNVVTYSDGGQCSLGCGKQGKNLKVVLIGHRLLSSLIPLSAGINPCWQLVVKPRGGISVNNNVSLICLSSSSHRWDGSQL